MARRKNKKTTRTIIIFIIIIAIIVVAIKYGGLIQRTAFAETCSGRASYEIQDATIRYNDEGQIDKIRVIATVAPQGGECAEVVLDKNELTEKLKKEGIEITKTRILDINSVEQKRFYTLYEIGNLFGLESRETDISTLTCSVEKCKDEGELGTIASTVRGLFWSAECECIVPVFKGKLTSFSEESRLQSNVRFSLGGETAEVSGGTRPSLEGGSATLGDKAVIKWQGDLFSGTQIEKPNNDVLIIGDRQYMVKEGTAILTKERFEEAKECIDRNLFNKVNGLISSPDSDRCIKNYNDFVDNSISGSQNNIDGFISRNPSVTDAYFEDFDFVVEAKSLSFPRFIIDIDADFVGIIKVSGEPRIRGCDNLEIESLTQERADFEIENIGNFNGVFQTALECDGKTQQFTEPAQTVSPDTSKIFTALINLQAEEKVETKECTLSVKDINRPENKDTCKFSVKVNPSSECGKEGGRICSPDGEEIWECQSDGKWKATHKCEFGCTTEEGKPKCRTSNKEICDDGIDNDNDGLIDKDDEDCKKNCKLLWVVPIPCFDSFLSIAIRTLFSLAGGLITLMLAYNLLEKLIEGLRKKKLKKETIIFIWVISILLGVAIGLSIYLYFWWGVSFLIAFIIIWGLMKFILGTTPIKAIKKLKK